MRLLLILGSIAVTLVGRPSSASAGTDLKETHELSDGMHVKVQVYSGLDILMKFPTRVLRAIPANSEDYNVELDDKELMLTTLSGAGITSMHVKLKGGESVAVLLKPADTPEEVILSHVFKYPLAKLAVVETCERDDDEAEETDDLGEMDNRFEFDEPMAGDWSRDGFSLAIETSRMVFEGAVLKFRIKVSNRGREAYPVAAVEVLDADSVDYNDAEADMTGGLPASLGPERDATGTILIRHPDTLGKGFQVRLLSGVDGVPPAVFSMEPIQSARPERPSRAFGPFEKRLLVTMTAVSGFANLDDGPDIGIGSGRKAWGQVNAVGLYGSYGAFKHVRFGGGGGFISTQDIAMETTQGTYTVKYHGARLYAGATVHAGRTLVPYAHARVGIMAVKHDFQRNGLVEAEYRMAGLMMLGGGIDWFASRHFLLGLTFSANGPIFGQETGLTFEAGLRAGWAFERAL